MAYHGHPRFTGDIALWVRPCEANADRIPGALEEFGFGQAGLSITDFVEPGQVIQLGRPPNRIDLLTQISGVDFDEAWSLRVMGELGQIPVFFLSRADLVTDKRASGRKKDLADLETLEEE